MICEKLIDFLKGINWKLCVVIVGYILFFIAGFLVGERQWLRPVHTVSEDIAFWSMLGGWVSGLATVAAVIVSLWMAYQASQVNVEKLKLTIHPIGHFNNIKEYTELHVKKLRGMPITIENLLLTIDGTKTAASLKKIQQGGQHLPQELNKIGDRWEFPFYVSNTPVWGDLLTKLSEEKTLVFKKGFFIIETTMGQYYLKVPDDILKQLKEIYVTRQI